MRLPPLSFTVLDTETTGFVPRVHRVIEFASVRVEDGNIVDEYEQLFSIGTELPPLIRALTHIHDVDLKGKPLIEEKRDEILQHIGEGTTIIGQNVSFDIGILRGEGIDLSERAWLDTSMLASLAFPELESYALAYMSSALQLNHKPVHRALGDVHATLELLGKCWDRFLELPAAELAMAKDIMGKSTPAYRKFFQAFPKATAKGTPRWMKDFGRRTSESERPKSTSQSPKTLVLSKPDVGTVELIEEPAVPYILQTIVDAASRDTTTVHWIAVKNLDSVVKRLQLSDEVRVLYPPFLLADATSVQALRDQESLTADEASLLLKLTWYGNRTQNNLPLHGDEHAVWNGKLACTESSPTYVQQFASLPTVVLLDHRQLLQFLADPLYAGRDALTTDAHAIIDDASMLEDTATKAYGWFCGFNDLRAAAEGDLAFTRLLDLAQIWIERTRNFQDIRYLTVSDVTSADARGLRDQLEAYLATTKATKHIQRQLSHMLLMLDEENLRDRITYIEHRIDGSQCLRSVPEHVSTFLRDHLYGTYATTLLIPPGSGEQLSEVLPRGTKTVLQKSFMEAAPSLFSIHFTSELDLGALLTDPPDDKTIVLSPSKRTIDDAFIRYAEKLGERGVTLICQGLSGGVNRATATFLAAEAPAILMTTPWAYEGLELPPSVARTLCLLALPFDHPSHAVLSKRAEHYNDPFAQYALPRMKQRLFRILRTLSNHAVPDAEVLIMDPRIQTKGYGKEVSEYLKAFSAPEKSTGKQMKML